MITRRTFLQSTAVLGACKAIFPKWMPRLAFREVGSPGDVLVNIFLRGGLDGLCAVVPFGEGRGYYDARPTQAIAEPGRGDETALDLDGFFGLHPVLAPLLEPYSAGDLAIVHATGLTNDTRSHFDAMLHMEYGTPSSKTTGTGWIGRHLQSAAWQNDSPFRAVGMGTMVQASLRGAVTPLALRSIADFHFRGREDEMRRIQNTLAMLYTIDAPTNGLDAQAAKVFDTVALLERINPAGYRPDGGAQYPETDFGMALRQVAQLIKADVGLEVACVDLGGWDTHENQGTLDGEFAFLLTEFAEGLAAFYADLGQRMNGVSLVAMSEFGRTLQENASYGTDHGHGNVMFLLGGGINGGQVYSDWPTLAPNRLADGDLAITTDYRDVLAEVITRRVGNERVDEVFPGFRPKPLNICRAL